MKLMFNKQTFESHWFYDDDEIGDDYTEKTPRHANQVFNEETNEWEDKIAIQSGETE